MHKHVPVRVLAISGSLRRISSNGTLLSAAARLAPASVEISSFATLADLPPFNPDLDDDRKTPLAVDRFRRTLAAHDAVLISAPEYAHGVPGVLKNALDWVVGSGEFIGKPVAVLNTSRHATHAWNSLIETLTVMSARVVADASIVVPLQGRALDVDGVVGDGALSELLVPALEALAGAARQA